MNNFPGSGLLPAACMELTQEQQRVLKFAKDGHSLIFRGQCGTGKTHLLRCLFIYKFGYSNLMFKCRIQGRSTIVGEGLKVKRGWGSNIGKGSGGSKARRKTNILRLRHEVRHFF